MTSSTFIVTFFYILCPPAGSDAGRTYYQCPQSAMSYIDVRLCLEDAAKTGGMCVWQDGSRP